MGLLGGSSTGRRTYRLCYAKDMDASSLDSLLNNPSGTDGSPASSLFNFDTLLQPLMPFIITLTIVSVLITALYLVSIIQKWRANAAVIEIRDILREMNARHNLPTPQPEPQDTSPTPPAL